MGSLMKALSEAKSSYQVEPVINDAGYTDTIIVTGPSGTKFSVLVREIA